MQQIVTPSEVLSMITLRHAVDKKGCHAQPELICDKTRPSAVYGTHLAAARATAKSILLSTDQQHTRIESWTQPCKR